MGALVDYAKSELALLSDGSDVQNAMDKHILKIVEVFEEEGHTGFTAGYAINLLKKLLEFKPVTPLTGRDEEWNEVGTGVWQNRRCSNIFKENDGLGAYEVDGIIFSDNGGETWFTKGGKASRRYISFPYTPIPPTKVYEPPCEGCKVG
jgi:hypothetical protein